MRFVIDSARGSADKPSAMNWLLNKEHRDAIECGDQGIECGDEGERVRGWRAAQLAGHRSRVALDREAAVRTRCGRSGAVVLGRAPRDLASARQGVAARVSGSCARLWAEGGARTRSGGARTGRAADAGGGTREGRAELLGDQGAHAD